MTGPEHYRRAEELAAKAAEYLGQRDRQDSAAVCAAVAQVHATLALAAATGSGYGSQAADVRFLPSSQGGRNVTPKSITRVDDTMPDPPPVPDFPLTKVDPWSSTPPEK